MWVFTLPITRLERPVGKFEYTLHELPPIQARLYNLIFYGDPVSFQRIVQVLIFLSAISCMIWAGFVTFAIIGEVNRKLPEEEQISYLWSHYWKSRKIKYEYRRLYPSGRLLFYGGVLTYLAFGFLLALALGWRFGVFK